MIVADPDFLAVTFPLLTVATLVLELLQVQVCTAFEGDISAFKVYVSPTPSVSAEELIDTFVGFTFGGSYVFLIF